MSKNELVSYIHALTRKTFKESRAICKAAKWNERTAVYIALYGGDFSKIIETTTEIKNRLISALTPAVESVINAFKELRESITPDVLALLEEEKKGGAGNV